MSITLRFAAFTLVAVFFSLSPASAQESPLYVDREHRFAAIFPSPPTAREVAYATRTGDTIPARQFFVESDAGRYAVTVVQFANGRSVDRRTVEHAAETLRRRGEILYQAYANY